MALKIFFEKGRHATEVFNYFDFNRMDAFYHENVLKTVFADDWYSILITENENAFFHVYNKQKITNTDFFDIEPFLGYYGPVCVSSDVNFKNKALVEYRKICNQENIIAELVRFNPLEQNHKEFEDTIYNIFPSKEIIILECFREERLQLKQCSDSCQRKIKQGQNRYTFATLNKEKYLSKFVEFYTNSIIRVGGDKKWLMNESFWQRVLVDNKFNINCVLLDGEMISGNLEIQHPYASYYLFAGNSDSLFPGASEFMIYSSSIRQAKNNIPYFILGGGNTNSSEDSLLKFKSKFTKGNSYTFYLANSIHNKEIFNVLCEEAIRVKPEIAKTNFFLKYRL